MLLSLLSPGPFEERYPSLPYKNLSWNVNIFINIMITIANAYSAYYISGVAPRNSYILTHSILTMTLLLKLLSLFYKQRG